MKKGLVNIDWKNISNYSSEEISYFLFIEGKSIDSISIIRNMEKTEIQRHVIEGKIKYRYLLKSKEPIDLIREIDAAPKVERKQILEMLNENNKNELVLYIKKNYVNMSDRQKARIVWILGELNAFECKEVLIKASVHKWVNIRRMAISAMIKIDNPYFEEIFIRTLNDNNPQVVMYSIKGLINLKSEKAKDKIIKVKKRVNKDYIDKVVEEYLKELELIEN